MYAVEISKEINNIISLFYYLGLWHRGVKATVRETIVKLLYCLYYLLFPISFIAGAIKSNNQDERIFSAEMATATAVISMKLCYIIWKKDQILAIITHIGVYSIKNREELTVVNLKLKRFTKFGAVLFFLFLICSYLSALAPFLFNEKRLFFNIGFPFDWKNNTVAFWLVNVFILTEATLTLITLLFTLTISYLMINCALRYQILGSEIKNIGLIDTNEKSKKRKISVEEKERVFLRDLIAAIISSQHIRESIDQLDSFISNVFFTQIVTSGICICGSIYCLAFNVGESLMEHIHHLVSFVYHISDIFVIMYFGNEIKLSSNKLSYCLFESNWTDKSQEIKKYIYIFGELLQSHELVVGKLYPLNLETFRRILNFAYNAFNILKNFKMKPLCSTIQN